MPGIPQYRSLTPQERAEGRVFIGKEISKAKQGIKNYGKNVAGGAKIVSAGVKKAANKLFK